MYAEVFIMPELLSTKKGLKLIGVALGLSVAVCAAALVVACLIAMMTDDPGGVARPAAFAALFAASAISGVLSAKVTGVASCGAVTGALLSLILFIISVCFYKSDMSAVTSFLLHLAQIAVAALGGVIAGRKKKRRVSYKKLLRKR